MSSSGHPELPPPTPAAAQALFAPLPRVRDRNTVVADAVQRDLAVAGNIAGAELRVVEGMGHDLPVALTATFAQAIASAAKRSG